VRQSSTGQGHHAVSLESDQAARCRHISGQHASVVVWRKADETLRIPVLAFVQGSAWRPEEIAHHHVDGYLRAPVRIVPGFPRVAHCRIRVSRHQRE
jgi:hypothetical protein